MNFNEMFPSRFLSADHLMAKDGSYREVGLTITHVGMETIGEGRDAVEKPVVYFEESKAGLVLNKTNGTSIKKLYGPNSDNWAGKRIVLYKTEVQVGSEMKDCIRIRNVADHQGARANGPIEAVPTVGTEDNDGLPF